MTLTKKNLTETLYLSCAENYFLAWLGKIYDVTKLRLYDLYACLYIRGQTQETIALDLGYTPQYIRKLINELFAFFRNNLSNKENENEGKP